MAFQLGDGSAPAAASPFQIPGFGAGRNSAQVQRNSPAGALPAQPGGFTPNYGWSLENDPLYVQQHANVNAANEAAGTQAGVGFGQALANYGSIPDFTESARQLGIGPGSPLYAILQHASQDPNTVAAAHELTQRGLSTVGQLGQQRQAGIADLVSGLAGRGAVQSGATTAGLDLQERQNTRRQYDATQTLLQHLGSLVQGYNGTRQQGVEQLTQGAQQAAARQIALNPSVPAALGQQLATMFGG